MLQSSSALGAVTDSALGAVTEPPYPKGGPQLQSKSVANLGGQAWRRPPSVPSWSLPVWGMVALSTRTTSREGAMILKVVPDTTYIRPALNKRRSEKGRRGGSRPHGFAGAFLGELAHVGRRGGERALGLERRRLRGVPHTGRGPAALLAEALGGKQHGAHAVAGRRLHDHETELDLPVVVVELADNVLREAGVAERVIQVPGGARARRASSRSPC